MFTQCQHLLEALFCLLILVEFEVDNTKFVVAVLRERDSEEEEKEEEKEEKE